MTAEEKKARHRESVRLYRLRQKDPNAASRRWRHRNKAAMDLLNRRSKRQRSLAVAWIRADRPDIWKECQLQAKREVPIADLAIVAEFDEERNAPRRVR